MQKLQSNKSLKKKKRCDRRYLELQKLPHPEKGRALICMTILKKIEILMMVMTMSQTRKNRMRKTGTRFSRAWLAPSTADTELNAGRTDSGV